MLLVYSPVLMVGYYSPVLIVGYRTWTFIFSSSFGLIYIYMPFLVYPIKLIYFMSVKEEERWFGFNAP